MIKNPVIKTNEKGERFILFFREYKDNGVCSNWYMSDFECFTSPGVKFNCVEQYMMYKKAMLFNDTETAEKILKETKPKEMKKYGRMVKNFDDSLWMANRYRIVTQGLYNKFSQNTELKNWLIKADCDYFVECSPYDGIWGIRTDINSRDCLDVKMWHGENLLGKYIMDVREIILAGVKSKSNKEE